eukprot:CAMPEP_0203636078 /NCGR_PEP_ID=MMETSP0088-20131115/2708_1 /ASSEMBLY_ACC=CAM_ASM_001087 /TAXON_ID=426623 /ORGANISM="Chaetoceros affinis, Strain CCMP159" /LENGTH=228 /DNA_ID=CAMNT_0050490121 /DNA_START=163 /DNA_END=849 /DNA_ORIENTATION=+
MKNTLPLPLPLSLTSPLSSTSTNKRGRRRINRKTTVLTSLLLQILILFSTSASTKSSFTFISAADVADFNPSNSNSNQFQILSEKREQLIDYTKQNIIQPIYGQYEQLSPKGKFLSTAFVGFTTSRFTVSTTIQIAKYFGAAFIISEVLNSAGILENIMNGGDDDDDDDNTMKLLKQNISTKVNECRLFVREHFLNVEKMKLKFDECLEKDRVGTLGFTTGAVVALVL